MDRRLPIDAPFRVHALACLLRISKLKFELITSCAILRINSGYCLKLKTSLCVLCDLCVSVVNAWQTLTTRPQRTLGSHREISGIERQLRAGNC